jgi:hypothetical protein
MLRSEPSILLATSWRGTIARPMISSKQAAASAPYSEKIRLLGAGTSRSGSALVR